MAIRRTRKFILAVQRCISGNVLFGQVSLLAFPRWELAKNLIERTLLQTLPVKTRSFYGDKAGAVLASQ